MSAGDHIRVRKLLQLNSDSQQARQAVKMMTLLQEEEFQNILKNPKLASLSEGPMHVIVINIECLALLNQLPNAIEAVKSDLLNELQSIGNLKEKIHEKFVKLYLHFHSFPFDEIFHRILKVDLSF